MSTIIHFADKSTLTLNENDFLIPVNFNRGHIGMGNPVILKEHSDYGLIPSIMDVFSSCNFFHVGNDDANVYGVASIVKIQSK